MFRRQEYGASKQEEDAGPSYRAAVSVSQLQAFAFAVTIRCSEKTLSYWQHGIGTWMNEGDMKSFTTNLCQKCFNMTLAGKRRKATDKCEVEAGCGKEGVSGKNVENDGKRTIPAWDAWNILSKKEAEQRGFESWPEKKSTQEYKVSGSRNRQPENTWSK